MSTYRFGNQLIKSDASELNEALATAYAAKIRPICMCRKPGIDMYIAKVSGKYVIKRMPNTGGDHTSACDSYEPPAELSGLGQVIGSAIIEDTEEGLTALKLDFSLTKSAGRSAPMPSGVESDSVKTDGNKLTLRGTLHFLWEQAGFNRWTPAMNGKRSWYVIRKHLIQAAQDKTTKGFSLSDIIYIPESFNVDKKDEISQRRIASMMRAAVPVKGTQRLMLVIGEVKAIDRSRYGYKIVFKHLSDYHFMMNEDIHKRLQKRFEMEISLSDALPDTHLIAIGTFLVSASGVASFEELALMNVTENWVPFETTFDKALIEVMTRANRRFMKGLRYNLPQPRPLACLVASDTTPEPTAMYVLPPGATQDYITAMTTLMEESKLKHWLWRAGESEMPTLPPLDTSLS